MNFKQYAIHNWDSIIWAAFAVFFFVMYMKQRLNIRANNTDATAMASKVYWLNFLFNIYFAILAVFGIAILKYLGVDVVIPETLYNFILVTTFFFSSVFIFSSLDSLVRYSLPYIRDIFIAKIQTATNIIPTSQIKEEGKPDGTQNISPQ